MRLLIALLLLITCLPAIELTVDTDFSMNEDTVLIFSYDDVMAKCTVTNGPAVGLKIAGLSGDGTVHIASSATGPWDTVPVVNTTIFGSGQFIRFVPNADVQGTNVTIINVRARELLGAESLARSVYVDIANLNDVITAASGLFDHTLPDPDEAAMAEDTRYIFTWEQLRRTLAINEPDPQAWTVRLTGTRSGRLWTADGLTEITTFPYLLPVPTGITDPALRWQPDADVFTKPATAFLPAEAPITAFALRAVNTVAPFNETAEVVFSTRVAGVADPIDAATDTTLTAMAPLVVTRGAITTFSYEQIHALASGTNDVDRVGSFNFDFSGPGAAGCIVRSYNDDGSLNQTVTLPAVLTLGIGERDSLQIIVPDSVPLGTQIVGTVWLGVMGSHGQSPWITTSFEVRRLPSPPSSGSGSSGGGGGGGCGGGSGLTGLLLLLLLPLLTLRRRRNAP